MTKFLVICFLAIFGSAVAFAQNDAANTGDMKKDTMKKDTMKTEKMEKGDAAMKNGDMGMKDGEKMASKKHGKMKKKKMMKETTESK